MRNTTLNTEACSYFLKNPEAAFCDSTDGRVINIFSEHNAETMNYFSRCPDAVFYDHSIDGRIFNPHVTYPLFEGAPVSGNALACLLSQLDSEILISELKRRGHTAKREKGGF